MVVKYLGFLFNCFTNEVPSLYKLINTKLYYKLGLPPISIKNTNNNIVNFVEDSNNLIGFKIGFKDHDKIKEYLENYFKLLEIYYYSNKLKLNNDKTKLILIA